MSIKFVSVPSSGDYQFLLIHKKKKSILTWSFRPLIRGLSISSNELPSIRDISSSFRPLIRGLSISSARRNS